MQKLKYSKNHTFTQADPFLGALSKTTRYHIEQSTWCPKIVAWGVMSEYVDSVIGMCTLEDSQGACWMHILAIMKPHLVLLMMTISCGEVQMSNT